MSPLSPCFVESTRDIDRYSRFLSGVRSLFLRGFPARALHAGRGSETLVGGTGINFSLPRRSVVPWNLHKTHTPYRIIAGPVGDASLALMTERSRIFTFNIIESRPLVEHPRFVGRFQYAQLETAQFSRWLPCGDRGHAFLSSRYANTLVYARLCSYIRDGIDRSAKKRSRKLPRDTLRLNKRLAFTHKA